MEQRSTYFWLRFTSAAIDLSVIYGFSVLLHPILLLFGFVDFSFLFSIVFPAYYLVCYLELKGRTLSKMLTGLKVTSNDGSPVTFCQILLREVVLKGFVGLAIPVFFIEPLMSFEMILFPFLGIMAMLLLSVLFLLVFKKTWWEYLSGTKVSKEIVPQTYVKKGFFVVASVLVLAIGASCYPLLTSGFLFENTFYPAYPVTQETTQYADFINTHRQDPVEYIFDLFKDHDLVVLSERMHQEYTQYELISKIVSDQRFTNEIGNLFTECGSFSFQDTVNTFLHTTFENEDALNKSAAILQRNSNGVWPLWSNTNLFDLLKTVNLLNVPLPDSAKLNWYFTDLSVDWNTMTHEKYVAGYTSAARDSIMASHILDRYKNTLSKQKRHKALVIMNTRHGYGPNNIDNKHFISEYNGTTTFLFRELPGKVANVMIHTVSLKAGYLFLPVQKGKWETAFEQAGNPNVGFNFANSPLGNDPFDLGFVSAKGVTYKDIFTGYVFYKPLREHFIKDGFPHIFDDFEDTILKRAACVNDNYQQVIGRMIAWQKQNPDQPVTTEVAKYAMPYNLTFMVLFPFLLLVASLISLFYLWRSRK